MTVRITARVISGSERKGPKPKATKPTPTSDTMDVTFRATPDGGVSQLNSSPKCEIEEICVSSSCQCVNRGNSEGTTHVDIHAQHNQDDEKDDHHHRRYNQRVCAIWRDKSTPENMFQQLKLTFVLILSMSFCLDSHAASDICNISSPVAFAVFAILPIGHVAVAVAVALSGLFFVVVFSSIIFVVSSIHCVDVVVLGGGGVASTVVYLCYCW
ncbi:Hypothetical predicted protein [Octopus vulgaris]|uniref:Uncharacterized protein n=1 Tax=Octopus vulgaris TaxID=6645 RepID=A0AA36FMM7_OCTVU|nr:Hypothetical predicted protein [Octopus vulgaris]